MEESLIKRVQPNSIEAEKAVLGSMLMDREAISAASELLTGTDFYQRQYGIMFDAMLELYSTGKDVDLVTLQDRMREKDVPPEACSIEVFRELYDSVPTSANIRRYAEIVYEKSLLRKLIHTTEDIANTCYAGKESLENILAETEKNIFKLLQTRSTSDYVPIQNVVLNVIRNVEAAAKNKSSVTGISTGFIDLDYKTSGFQPSDLILIAARPSMGKTAFTLNIAEAMAIKHQVPTVIFSLEMSKEQLVNRLLSMESSVSSQNMRIGRLEDREWDQLIESAGVVADAKLIIDDTPGISISELRSKCRRYQLEFGIQCVMIDYLQLMSGSGSKSSEASRQQEISEISRSLKALARELKVPVIALSQLSRACETRTDHRPMLSDLRESGAIEQDADVVMFIYRDDYYNKDTEAKNIAEIIIAKQRNGPIGTVELAWKPEFTRFCNMERSRD